MAARNLVLIGLLEFQHSDLLGAPLLHDLSSHLGFGSVRSGENFLVFRVHRQDRSKVHNFADIAANSFNSNSIARRDTVLLAPGFDYRVHKPPPSKDKPLLYELAGNSVNEVK